jgi:signal transduction histidine kinase
MDRLLLSPTAISFVPAIVLHLVTLGYLVSRTQKSRQTWLFIGWMACLMLLMASQCVARIIYGPVGGYIDWMSGTIFAWMALLLLLQFAYHFPGTLYAREARTVLIVTSLIGVGLLLMIVLEATLLPALPVYNFELFWYGLSYAGKPRALTSTNLFAILQLLGYLWIPYVWIRKAVVLSERHTPQAVRPPPCWRRIGRALWRPHGQEAHAVRALTLVFLLVPLAVLASSLELQGVLPVSSFANTYMIAIFAFVVTYVNHAPEPSTFMVKLVGITFVSMLVVLEVVNSSVMVLHRGADERVRQAELLTVETLIDTRVEMDGSGQAYAGIPAQVQYIAARPAAGGLFSDAYQLLFTRTDALTAQTLADYDARLQERLAQGQAGDVLLENTWIGPLVPEAERRLSGTGWQQLTPPPGVRRYRGVYAPPEGQYLSYNFLSEDGQTLYEVGYSYLSDRQRLHHNAMPLLYLTLGVPLLTLFVFPLFFQSSLVRPLGNLLNGVKRVDEGDLSVSVPVMTADEVGTLTRAFNGMVHSLQTSAANLRAEIAERQRAEAQLQALNVTLEQRVSDRTRDLSALYAVSAVASQTTSLDKLLTESLARTLAVMSSALGAIYLLTDDDALADERQPHLRLAVQQGIPPDQLAAMAVLSPEGGVTGWVMEHREPLLIPNSADLRVQKALGQAGPLSLLIAPMQAEEGVVGIMVLGRAVEQGFKLEEVTLLASIADQVGLAAHSDRLRQQAIVFEERQRLARDLHDSVTQSLYGLVTLAEVGQAHLETEPANPVGRTLARIGQTARQALKEMRLYVHQLRPPVLQEEGLAGALALRLSAVEGRTNVQTRLVADESIQRLPPSVASALYQIAQEALNNVLRHTLATSVTVQIHWSGERVTLEIVDDGGGFDLAAADGRGMGLTNMRERARQVGGTLDITSAPAAGTRVRVSVPVTDEINSA